MSDSSLLVIDAGNTRLKWAVKQGGALHHHGAHTFSAAEDYGVPDALSEALTQLPDEALMGSVASTRVGQVIRRWLTAKKVPLTEVEVGTKQCLQLAYTDHRTLGVDRWLAMLGAQVLSPGALCVADCGTALTLDAVDQDGRHLGGLITPGFELMQSALLSRTARINAADQPLPESLFGDSTGAAVNAGATYSLAAILDRFVAETAASLSCDPVVMVTGGGRERLLRYAHSDAIEVPDLVLLGMASLSDVGV